MERIGSCAAMSYAFYLTILPLAEITSVKAGVYHVAAGLLAFLIGFYVFDNRVAMIKLYSDYYPAPVIAFTLLFLLLANLFLIKGGKGAGKSLPEPE